MPPAIKNIGVKFMKQPEHVKIKAKEMTADLIDQYYVRSKDFEKFDIMTRLLDVQTPELTIVFGRTKRRVDELARGLEARGYKAEGIHGDLSQQKRMSVLRSFKNGNLDILVATDVAARGLDISGVTHVYNYDIPQDPESYVHRIGRTGRAGKGGMSVTFVTPNEMGYLHVIENLTKKRMTPLRPPTEKEAFKGQLSAAVETIESDLEENGLDKYLESAEALLEKYSATDLAALLLKTVAKDPADAVPVKLPQNDHCLQIKKALTKMAVVVAVGTTVIATVVAMVKVAAIVATKTIKMATVITKIATAKIKINVAANVITIKTWFRHSRKRQIIKERVFRL